MKIARGMSYLGRTPPYRELLPAGAAEATEELALAAGVVTPWMIRFYESGGFRWLASASDRWVMPGQLLGSALRKRFVNDRVCAALDEGATQVLVLGAGFDALCLRLAPRYPEVTFVEVDHPATSRQKQAGVRRLGPCPNNLSFAEADLSTLPLAEALAPSPWRPDARGVVVAEGVLMYLGETAVVELLEAIHRLSGVGTVLVATLIEPRPPGWLGAALSLVGESLRWGITRAAVPSFFADHGYRVIAGSADLRASYLAGTELGDAPLPVLEHVVAAVRVERPRSARGQGRAA